MYPYRRGHLLRYLFLSTVRTSVVLQLDTLRVKGTQGLRMQLFNEGNSIGIKWQRLIDAHTKLMNSVLADWLISPSMLGHMQTDLMGALVCRY